MVNDLFIERPSPREQFNHYNAFVRVCSLCHLLSIYIIDHPEMVEYLKKLKSAVCGIRNHLRKTPIYMNTMSENGMADFKSFYNNESLSDVILVFSGRRIPVHKVILSAQNKYFSKLFEGPFSESSAPEVELHDDDPDDLERLLKCLYGHDPDVLNEYYAAAILRADPEEPEPRDGWSSDSAINNCLRTSPRRWNRRARAWELSPRCRGALSDAVDLYVVADKYLAAGVRDALVRRVGDFSLLHWFFYGSYFSLPVVGGEEEEGGLAPVVDVGEIAGVFCPLYEQTAGPEDPMRRALAGFFGAWWVTSVGPVPERLLELYEALPDLCSDVLRLQASRAAERKGDGLKTRAVLQG